MGKLREKKHFTRMEKASPTGLISVKAAEEQQELSVSEATVIEPILERLQSTEPEEREYGCAALGIYLSQPHVLKLLLRRDIVRTVAPLLMDTRCQVQLSASALLRTMSVEGGYEACEEMIKQEIVTYLGSHLKTQVLEWQSGSTVPKVDGKVHAFVNSLYTVQNLCECSALAVRMAIEDAIPDTLMACLLSPYCDSSALLASAQCLYTMSEENDSILDMLRSPAQERLLLALIKGEDERHDIFVKVIVAGILNNVYGADVVRSEGRDSILSVLLRPLEEDTYQLLVARLSQSVLSAQDSVSDHMDEGHPASASELNGTRESKPVPQSTSNQLKNLVCAQKLSFEILTNLCVGDDAEEWIDEDGSGSDLSCESMEAIDSLSEDVEVRSCEILGYLLDRGLLAKLLSHLKFLDAREFYTDNADDMLKSENTELLCSYDGMLASGLLFLNNIVSTLSLEQLGGSERLQAMTVELLSMSAQPHVNQNEALLEAITSATRAIAVKLAAQSQLVLLDSNHISILNGIIRDAPLPSAVNAVRVLAALGSVIANTTTESSSLRMIGQTFIDIVTSRSELWLVAEALDSLMDVYAEDNNNDILRELNILPVLDGLMPALKQKLQQRDKNVESCEAVLSTVKINLPRFIKYKKSVIK